MFNIVKAGEQIAFLRKSKNLTQENLANKLGISPQAVSKWENGHTMPEASILSELSDILDCSIDKILRPDNNINMKANYIQMLLPYNDVAEYTGAKWPRGMAFPSVMATLKLFMGLEKRLNFKNQQVNDMKKMDNWLKQDMEFILLYNIENKLTVEEACKKALYNYCLLMSGKWDKEEFYGSKTIDSFKKFMNYGSEGYIAYINFLKQSENFNGFFPQDCILYESCYRTMGFLNMCKMYLINIDTQYLDSAIKRYGILCQHAHDIFDVVGGRLLVDKNINEKKNIVINCLIRSNEIFNDAVSDIVKAINFQL